MPRCDWLQHCNFLEGIEILPFTLQTACKPYGFAAGRPAIVAGPVLRVAIGESCSVCRALKDSLTKTICRSTTIETKPLDSHCDISRTTCCHLLPHPPSKTPISTNEEDNGLKKKKKKKKKTLP